MALTNTQRVQRAMQLLSDGLGPFVDGRLTQALGADWPAAVSVAGRPAPANARADTHFLLSAMIHSWREGGFGDTLGYAGRSWVSELLEARNRWAHNEAFSSDQAYRALDTAQLLLNAVAAGALAAEIDPLRQELLRSRFAEEERQVRRRRTTAAVEGTPVAGLLPWREVITPHRDVSSGRYQQAEFAANLHQVWREEAPSEYGDAREFFGRTYLTEGLRELALNAVRRLRGEGGDPIVALQTNFGGGKTHSLIALLHLAGGHAPADLPGVEEMLIEAGLGPPPRAATAVLVGQRLEPASVTPKPDGTEVRTMWGELAWQLGKAKGFALVADADRAGTNPGEALVHLLRAHAPCLVLIDEWVAYARQLYGHDGLPAGSFDAHFSFAQALTEAVREVPDAMLVVSIPASDIEVGGEGGREALKRLVNVVGRLETSWKPATADEGFEIVRRRLFEPIPPELVRERDAVAHRFAELYRAQRAEFPPECAEADYERRIVASYPIHPELFDRLYGEWSTLERFQRTRGVLRLMAAVIYELWRREDRSLLVLPGTLPIEASRVVAELTNYLDETWTPVIATDVDGENALPLRLDNENPAFMRYSATRRVARTIFLGSAPITDAANRGIDDRRVKLGCVQPGEAPATFGDALRRLANQAHYLSTDGQRSWYGLQQTVTRLASDRAGTFDNPRADEEIRKRLLAIRDTGDFVRLHAAPTAATEVEDEPTARLVLLDPEHPHTTKVAESAAQRFATQILDDRAGGTRTHRNMLAFMAPDVGRVEELREAVRMSLAWNTIDRDRESLRLDSVQLAQIDTRRDEWHGTVQQRIGETYQWLLVPSAEPKSSEVVWETFRVSGSDPLAVRASRRLRSEEALITTYSGARLRMDLDRIPLWREDRIEVRDLWGFYTQYLYLSRLRDVSVLLGAIADGAGLLTWRQDGFAYADGVDESAGRFAGLRVGPDIALPDPVGVLVRSDVAETQFEAERPETPASTVEMPAEAPYSDGTPVATARDQPDQATSPVGGKVLRRFFGSVALDPTRLSRDAGEVGEAVVAHLNGLMGADVHVTLEIHAEIPDGAPEDVVRTVTENAMTLRFDPSTGFEPE
jgi:hypothetical protein